MSGAVGDKAEGHGGVEVSAGGVRDDDTGEDREAPADVHHQEAPVEPLCLGQGDVCDDTTTEQNKQGGAHQFRYEINS